MARIPVQPTPKRTPWWAWLLGLVALVALVLLLLDLLDLGDGRPDEPETAAVADTLTPTDVVITDVAALAGAVSASDVVGRQVSIPSAEIVDVVGDSLFFIDIAGAGVSTDTDAAAAEGAVEDGQSPPVVGGATEVSVFGDRILVLLDAPGTGLSGLRPGQTVAIQGRVEALEDATLERLRLSDEQRQYATDSGLYIRATTIGAPVENTPADTTGS